MGMYEDDLHRIWTSSGVALVSDHADGYLVGQALDLLYLSIDSSRFAYHPHNSIDDNVLQVIVEYRLRTYSDDYYRNHNSHPSDDIPKSPVRGLNADRHFFCVLRAGLAKQNKCIPFDSSLCLAA